MKMKTRLKLGVVRSMRTELYRSSNEDWTLMGWNMNMLSGVVAGVIPPQDSLFHQSIYSPTTNYLIHLYIISSLLINCSSHYLKLFY